MKILLSIVYIFGTLLYVGFGNSSLSWAAFNAIHLQISLAAGYYFASQRHKRVNGFERVLFNYSVFISLFRAIYTLCCVYSPSVWVYSTNTIFVAICVPAFIAYTLSYILKRTK